MAEDQKVGWHHRLDEHEYEQAPGVGDGKGGLACYSPWGRKESDTTERLNRTELYYLTFNCADLMQSKSLEDGKDS